MTVTHPEVEHEAIHSYFSLSYANYLVLPRTLLQSMPDEWQTRMVACLRELDDAFRHVPQAEAYKVQPAREREVGELTDDELRQVGYSKSGDECDCYAEVTGSGEVRFVPPTCPHETTYRDDKGNEVSADHIVMWPLDHDPVPHYNRGRTYIKPNL
ncbi:hypothetical protein [Microbispora rosea]|uniref:hypothetical protein n=1 Tax=Microbispora rosea TaxID=58117 RepID=UPI00068C5C24|nr:hypothetical protein [Microbispora rosea]